MPMRLPYETDREILEKKETRTNKEVSCKPEERDIDEMIDYGIINLNKPAG